MIYEFRMLDVSVGLLHVTIGSQGGSMHCPRCKGRMFAETYYDFVRSFDAWKCTSCGELLDPTILANRAWSNNTHLG